eukprot:11179791-Lingulodinium_polyedra.AAC.1
MDSIENELADLGIVNFWKTPNVRRTPAQAQRPFMRKLPASARCRCLQATRARLDALDIPEGLKHRSIDPEGTRVSANVFRQ